MGVIIHRGLLCSLHDTDLIFKFEREQVYWVYKEVFSSVSISNPRYFSILSSDSQNALRSPFSVISAYILNIVELVCSCPEYA